MHFRYVWKKYIMDSGFKRINIIALAEGGKLLFDQLQILQNKFFKIIGKMAFVNTFILSSRNLSIEQHEFMQANAVNYKAHNAPKGQHVGMKINVTCPRISTGHMYHNYAISNAWDLI